MIAAEAYGQPGLVGESGAIEPAAIDLTQRAIKKPFRITRNGVFQPGDTPCLGRKGFAATTTLARVGI